jgi:hypothetical protein
MTFEKTIQQAKKTFLLSFSILPLIVGVIMCILSYYHMNLAFTISHVVMIEIIKVFIELSVAFMGFFGIFAVYLISSYDNKLTTIEYRINDKKDRLYLYNEKTDIFNDNFNKVYNAHILKLENEHALLKKERETNQINIFILFIYLIIILCVLLILFLQLSFAPDSIDIVSAILTGILGVILSLFLFMTIRLSFTLLMSITKT